ncbi:MAG: IS701 family transposase [Actinomycetia bacterium]|nr:IS701 family transposase [Actinomycetes bacterium]
MELVSGRFARPEAARNAADLVAGLVSDLERKNCWTIAERSGHSTPDRLQHLLSRAARDVGGVRDDLRRYVADRLLGPGEEGVLVVDETGDLKKGTATVGVQRQYTGTAGRVENAQVAVFLTLVGARGHTFIDRALYLPRCWVEDLRRRHQAGVPDNVEFATKPALAAAMITHAVTGGVPAGWVTGDEVYGACPKLRAAIRGLGLGYVLAVASNHRATYPGAEEPDLASDLALTIGPWQRLSAGPGAKGHRYYSWARTRIEPEPHSNCHHWLLIRRNDTTGELAYYRCWHPEPVALTDLVAVAGKRWRIEENFQAAKGHVGLDQHQVRRWDSWHRWTTLAMAAHALLTIVAATTRDTDTTTGLIPITLPEARRLLLTTWQRAKSLTHALHWSHWRRQHQHRAQQAHYRHRGDPAPP